ncbi:MAG: YicC/YloC family endoribonuclease, partial [Pseudomonadota bacterium]|nr:YicC/YloC family endoribonuclease [Pseudomonadota bacterium]
MSLSSMTGFGRAEGRHGRLHWNWEAKSVNGRSLD